MTLYLCRKVVYFFLCIFSKQIGQTVYVQHRQKYLNKMNRPILCVATGTDRKNIVVLA